MNPSTKILILFFLIFTLTSCDQFLENILEREAINNYNSPYQGKYDGTYTGDLSGNFTLEIGKSGSILGLRDGVDYIGGKVYEGGVLQNAISLTSGFQLNGSLISNSGTWQLGNQKGTWSATKQ